MNGRSAHVASHYCFVEQGRLSKHGWSESE